MELYAVLQYGVFLLIVTALVYPVGGYLTRVFGGESTWLDPGLRPLERVFYRLAGIDAHHEMDWKEYASAFLVFSAAGTLLLYVILRVQPFLHTFDPLYQPAPLSPDLALNTAISFATTTTWQAYGGETTMSYLSQMVGLAVQNFLAGAAGLAVGIAFLRGLVRERMTGLGNFWVDLTRVPLWVLLPLALVGGLLLVWQGVPANLKPYQMVPLLQPTSYQQPNMDSNGNTVTDPSGQPIMETVQVTQQVIPQGPVAVLEFIKNLGTNGGGFFNTNITTSNGATGSYNAMHDSFTPLGGMIPLGNMLLGEVIFGGLGTGLVSLILVALIGVFIGGMMVGRPPEYLGKPLGPPEMKLISLYALLGPATILLLTALAAVTAWGLAGLTINSGPHGLSEIVYAYASSMANNGQNFAGLNANTPFYNITTALAMMVGRFGLTILALALAGRLAPQPRRPVSLGTLTTDTPLFAGWLMGIIVIIGGLSCLPVLALGPLIEHLWLRL